MTGQDNQKRLLALGFSAFSLPAVLLLPSLGWLWTMVVCFIGAAFLAVLIGFGVELRAKWMMAALLAWNLVMLGVLAGLLCKAFPTGDSFPAVGLLVLLLAVYAGNKGTKVVLRCGTIVFFFLVGLYLLMLGFSLTNLTARWLRPVTKMRWELVPAVLVPVPLVVLAEKSAGRPWATVIAWLTAGVALATLIAVVCAGSLSPRVVAREAFPFYTAAKSVSVLGTMERLEPLVSAALTAGGFCLLAGLCCVNERLMGSLVPKRHRFATFANFAVGGGILLVGEGLPLWVIAVGTAIFWGILPVLPQLVVFLKKRNFFQKNT